MRQRPHRAARLLISHFARSRTGEIDIPAVRGLREALLVDDKTDLGRHWEIDFDVLQEGFGGIEAGLITIDHVSQSMQPESADVAVYTSLLGIRKRRSRTCSIGGIVHSRSLRPKMASFGWC